MRFYTRRCEPNSLPVYDIEGYDSQGALFDPEDLAMPELVSDRVQIVDTAGVVLAFNVDEDDAEYVCAALNAADLQEKLCGV